MKEFTTDKNTCCYGYNLMRGKSPIWPDRQDGGISLYGAVWNSCIDKCKEAFEKWKQPAGKE